MRYRLFGKSGLRVSELCLGTMTFGEDWGWGANSEESKKIYELFRERGGNFIDTANMYTNGNSETILGGLLKEDRDQVVLATKYSLTMRPSDPNGGGNHRKSLRENINASLKRLNTDYIDILWVHAWDFCTPIEEVMRALDDLVRMGKVLYLGISDTPAWIISEANAYAKHKGLTPFSGIQVEYNLLERTAERDLLPMASHHEMAVTAWSPLAGGALTGKYLKGKEAAGNARLAEGPWGDPYMTERNLAITQAVSDLAQKKKISPAQLALSWIRSQDKNALMFPIVGARSLEHVKDNLDCLNIELDSEDLNHINEISKIELGFPHEFLSREGVRAVIYGETESQLEKR